MEVKEIFEFKTYKEFLRVKTGPSTLRLGVKTAMAKALKCQPTYVSQVLNGTAHFSLEQGDLLSDFLGLINEEKHFFLLLLQRDRAGTKRLEQYFTDQIEQVLTRRLVLTNRLGKENSITPEHQSIYYSSWHYAAIHIALTIPELRQPAALARALGLPLKRISETLDFLCRTGLARQVDQKYILSKTTLRLGRDSHNILKHHTNWRTKAIESLDREEITDLHYSAVVSLGKEDVVKLKDHMLKFIAETIREVRNSKEEELYCYCIDFFDLTRET